MNQHNRPWYWKLLDRCRKCYSYAAIRKTEDQVFFKCAICDNQAEPGINEGVAICNWNKLQRKLKKK